MMKPLKFKEMEWTNDPEHKNIWYAKPLDGIKPGLGIGYRIWHKPNGEWYWMPDNGPNEYQMSFEKCKKAADKHWQIRASVIMEVVE